MKVCIKCKEEKDESMFHKHKMGKSGVRTVCKPCRNYLSREFKKEHRDATREYNKRWKQEHPEMCRAQKHKRRVMSTNSPFPKEFKLGSYCWVCLSTEKLTVDHIIPVSRGGTNSIENLITLCGSCNSSKGSMLYSEWFEKRAYHFQTWLLSQTEVL